MNFIYKFGKNRSFWLLSLALTIFHSAHSQTANPVHIKSISQKVNLFIHLDKSIYQPLETIWLTGYILNRDEQVMREQNTLYTLLIDPVSKSVVAKQHFVMQSGFGKGFLTLPDSLTAGDYWLLGYTNSLLETGEQPVFRQLISVRTSQPSSFRISAADWVPGDDSLRIRYKITTSYGGIASGGKFRYTLYDSSNALISGEKLIDAFGEVIITVGPKLDSGKYRDLSAVITRGDLSKKLIVPVYTSKTSPSEKSATLESTASSVDVRIEPDSVNYHRRSKVTLHIRLTDGAGHSLPGIFSLAVAASKRMDPCQARTIVQYDQQPDSWTTSVVVNPELKRLAGNTPVYGYVLEDDNPVKKPVSLALMGNTFASFKTDAHGQFALPYNALVTPVGGVNYLSVTDKSPERYKIEIFSRADTFDRQLAALHYPLLADRSAASLQNEDLIVPPGSDMLQAAVVKAQSQTEYNSISGEYNSTHCNEDYVCTHNHGGPQNPEYNVVNCPFVKTYSCAVVKPVEGGRYTIYPPDAIYRKSFGAPVITYHCATPAMPAFMKVLDPILQAKAFPLPCAGDSNILGSGLQSTVYWNHALTTNADGETTISFYTDDLTGNFTCFLQGVSAAGVIAGRSSFSVVKQELTGNATAQNSGTTH